MNRTCTRSGHRGGYYYTRAAKLMQLFSYWTCKVILFDAFWLLWHENFFPKYEGKLTFLNLLKS
jgi:hypothetical protein